jgi:hypothetical protein
MTDQAQEPVFSLNQGDVIIEKLEGFKKNIEMGLKCCPASHLAQRERFSEALDAYAEAIVAVRKAFQLDDKTTWVR